MHFKEENRVINLGDTLKINGDTMIIIAIVRHKKSTNILFLNVTTKVYQIAIDFDFAHNTWKKGDEYSDIEQVVEEWQYYY